MNRYIGKIDNKELYVDSPNVIWIKDKLMNTYTPCFKDKAGSYIALPYNSENSFNNFYKNDYNKTSLSIGVSEEYFNNLRKEYPNTQDNTSIYNPENANLQRDKNNNIFNNNDIKEFTTIAEGVRRNFINYPKYNRSFTTVDTTVENNGIINFRNTNKKTLKGNPINRESGGGGALTGWGSGKDDSFTGDGKYYSFFDLLGLGRANNGAKFNSFIPIVLKVDSPYMGEVTSKLENLVIELPMKGGVSISDNVSVQFNRRLDSSLPWSNLIGEFVSKTAQSISNDEGVAMGLGNFAQFTYNTSSLRKILNLNFIVPVAASTKKVEINKIRAYLTMLQGMLYPTDLTKLYYPPMLSLTIGGMYTRFFGFLTEVNIEWGPQGEFVNYNNINKSQNTFENTQTGSSNQDIFPQVIEGTIKFENLFSYNWDNGLSSFSADIEKYFTIKKDGSEGTLFGVDDNSEVSGVYDGQSFNDQNKTLTNMETRLIETDPYKKMFENALKEFGWNDYFFNIPNINKNVFVERLKK